MAEKNDFTWHKVSEKEKQEIQKQAKKILNDFSSALEKVKTSETHPEQGSGMREQGEPWQTDQNFRDIMFSNAPFVDDDSIVAEKGEWKKNNK